MENTKKMYKGAFTLLIAGLLSKVISAFYRIPLQNLTGDIGFYIYQQIYPIIGIALTFALYGFPAAISKYVTEHPKEQKNKKLFSQFFWIMAVFSIAVCTLLFILSPVLSDWMGDDHLLQPLRHTAFVFLCIPFAALLRGWTQSYKWMSPTAYSQMIEQVLRACILIFTAILIYKEYLSVYTIAEGAVLASIVASIASFLFLMVYTTRHLTFQDNPPANEVKLQRLISPIIFSGIVISFNHMLLILIQLADAFSLVPGLLEYGLPLREAMVTKGIFDRGQPLLQLVTIVGSSLALAMVPQVTNINWQMNKQDTLEKIQLTTKYGTILSVGATTGLVMLLPEINGLLYQNAAGSNVLRLLAVSLLFTSLSITFASAIQGFGYTRWTAIVLFIGLWLKIILNQLLVPCLGINGGAVATLVTVMFICLTNLFLVRRFIKKERLFTFSWLKILAAGLIMAAFLFIVKLAYIWMNLPDSRFILLLFVMFNVVAGFLVFMYAVKYLNVLSREEWHTLPIIGKLKKGRLHK